MYYQILVETVDGLGKSKREKKIYEIDKTNKDEIIKDILVPYMSEEEFIIDGYSIKKENVIRLKIVTTERSVRELADLIIDTSNSNVYDDAKKIYEFYKKYI